MAIETINFNRGEYNYIHYLGIDGVGQSVDYMDRVEVDEISGYPVRYFPDFTHIERDKEVGKGAVKYIETQYLASLIDTNSNPLRIQNRLVPLDILTYRTNHVDKIGFIGAYGLAIMRSSMNGLIEAKLGFNDLKVYNPLTGAVLNYNAEQLAAPPTNTYYVGDITD